MLFRSQNTEGYFEVLQAGATYAIPDEREASLRIASYVLESVGCDPNDVRELRQNTRVSMESGDDDSYKELQLEKIKKVNEKNSQSKTTLFDDKNKPKQITLIKETFSKFIDFSPMFKNKNGKDNSAVKDKNIVNIEEIKGDNTDDVFLGVTVCMLSDKDTETSD